MVRVRLSPGESLGFSFRQTPDGDGRWGQVHFSPRDDESEADWLVVYDTPEPGLITRVPRARRIVLLPEPVSIKTYPASFIAQFGIVLSPSPVRVEGVRWVRMHPCAPWFLGCTVGGRERGGVSTGFRAFENAGLAALEAGGAGRARLSAICSRKRLNRNQVRRLRFLDRLKRELGPDLDIFGRGFSDLPDKARGIVPYRYHMVLENNLERCAWTEKLADPLLAGVYPIFAGGEGLDEHFDPKGFSRIDITRPRAAVEKVREILESDPVARPDVQAAMRENRRRLMHEHQLFPVLAREILEGDGANRARGDSEGLLDTPEAILPAPRRTSARVAQFLRPLRIAADKLVLTAFERG
jgi:hypothetical protein